MVMPFKVYFPMAAVLFGVVGAASAQNAPPKPSLSGAPVSTPAPGGNAEGAEAVGKLVLLFDTGTTSLNARNQAILDKAARLYSEGQPAIMIVTGSTDAVGSPVDNLLLSERRATAVMRGMVARGIPAERTQILAKGETNPSVAAKRGVPEAENRRVEITWR